jgi:hypothetical protein
MPGVLGDRREVEDAERRELLRLSLNRAMS